MAHHSRSRCTPPASSTLCRSKLLPALLEVTQVLWTSPAKCLLGLRIPDSRVPFSSLWPQVSSGLNCGATQHPTSATREGEEGNPAAPGPTHNRRCTRHPFHPGPTALRLPILSSLYSRGTTSGRLTSSLQVLQSQCKAVIDLAQGLEDSKVQGCSTQASVLFLVFTHDCLIIVSPEDSMVKFQRKLTGSPSPRSASSAKLAAERGTLVLPSSHPARSFSVRAPRTAGRVMPSGDSEPEQRGRRPSGFQACRDGP